MRVEIAVAAAGLRRWHLRLAERVASACGAEVRFKLGTGPGAPAAVDLLLRLEGMIGRRVGSRLSERLLPADVPALTDANRADLAIVLDDSEPSGAPRRLAVRFDGGAGDPAAFAALLGGRAPAIEVVDETGVVLAGGLPSLEAARSIAEAYEHAMLRAVTLVLKALATPARSAAGRPVRPAATASRGVVGYCARTLARSAARRLYKLCCHAPHWRVGWRFVTDGDVWDRRGLGGTPWTVLADPGIRFFADPFPIRWRGETWVFVEDLDHRHGRGVISAVPFDTGGPSGPMRTVLDEPFHLSYPSLVEYAGELWMIPETSADRTVRIYRCERFPDRWVAHACLLQGVDASDATLVRHEGRWWMFATVRDDEAASSDTLCLFMADDLFGPWRPHPGNPILVDAGTARPAGNLVLRGGALHRPVQDCRGGYGTGLGLATITRLDPEGFGQEVGTVLRPGPSWPGRRLHTLNRAGDLECIDGSGHSPKLAA